MIPEIKAKDIGSLFPRRSPNSHKGMNGKVMIVGGSIDYFGAPLLSGLGALYSGADLVYLFVPEANFDVTRSHYPDFIVRKFPGEFLDMKAVSGLLDFAGKCDALLIGPGLGDREETMNALHEIILKLPVPAVLDASAIQILQKIKEFPLSQKIVITPHHNEFEHLTGKDVKITSSISSKVVLVRTLATDLKINILLKGPQDVIASEDGTVVLNSTGNAGMTVAGSGDVLSGFITTLIAQGTNPFEACKIAAFVYGKAGEHLQKQKGFCFSATDLAFELPYIIRQYQ